MSINSLIIDALTPTGVPVDFQQYIGEESTYITFLFYDESGFLFADNIEQETAYYVQIDVWSKNDYTDLVDQVKSILSNKGFAKTSAVDLYEQDTKIYHKAMRFVYIDGQD
jgi:hypothetical protein